MAYATRNGTGPVVAGHRGEWVSNHTVGVFGIVRAVAPGDPMHVRNQWFRVSGLREGRPRPEDFGEPEYRAGLYLPEDRDPRDLRRRWDGIDFVAVPTPPELMEPGREHLYNAGGRPGLQAPPEAGHVVDDLPAWPPPRNEAVEGP